MHAHRVDASTGSRLHVVIKYNLVMYRLAQPQNYVIQETGLSRDHRTSRFVVNKFSV